MTTFAQYPEIILTKSIFNNEKVEINLVDNEYISLNFDHPNLGEVVEVFKKISKDHYSLKLSYPKELQEEEEILIAKDYYNLHLLQGSETYIEYYNSEDGWYLISRNYEEQ